LIFKDQSGDLVLVEVKLGRIGRDATSQLKRYLRDLRRDTNRNVRGIIVGSGIMPAYEADLSKQKDIDIYVYGWQLHMRLWQRK
jgi:RecB family endonuclease NucS